MKICFSQHNFLLVNSVTFYRILLHDYATNPTEDIPWPLCKIAHSDLLAFFCP